MLQLRNIYYFILLAYILVGCFLIKEKFNDRKVFFYFLGISLFIPTLSRSDVGHFLPFYISSLFLIYSLPSFFSRFYLKSKKLILSINGIFCFFMTAKRYMSLSGKMTEEDLFSSDLTDNELNTQLGHVKNNEIEDQEINTKRKTTKSCCVLSGSDQYVSSSLLEKYDDFGKRMALHLGGDYHIVKGGTHGLPKSIHYKEFIQVVQDRLKNIKQIMNS